MKQEQEKTEYELLKPGMMPHKRQEKLHLDEPSILKHCTPGTWSNGYGSSFKVRQGPNYVKTRKKAPSAESIYEIFAFDCWKTEKFKITNVAQFYEIPSRPVVSEKFYLPPVLIINVLVPAYDPPLFGYEMNDGEGWSMVIFAELTQSSKNQLVKGSLTPGMKLFQQFIEGGKDSPYGDRLKVIARILNINEAYNQYGPVVGLLVSQYNGTPFLARDSPTFYHVPGKYFGIDLDAHLFGTVAKKGLAGIKNYMNKIVYDIGFLIEGRSNEENPEQILASIRISKIGSCLARPFPFEARLDE